MDSIQNRIDDDAKELIKFLKEHNYVLPSTEEEFIKLLEKVKEKGLLELPKEISDPKKITQGKTKSDPNLKGINVNPNASNSTQSFKINGETKVASYMQSLSRQKSS